MTFLKRKLKTNYFLKDTRAVAAVEFALIFIPMILIYLGTFEVTRALIVNRKVKILSRTVADLASRPDSLTNAEISNIFNASTQVLFPYPSRPKTTIKLYNVIIDTNKKATILWTESMPPGKSKNNVCGSYNDLPKDYLETTGGLVIAVVEYEYTPFIGFSSGNFKNSYLNMTFSETTYMTPRKQAKIGRTTNANSSVPASEWCQTIENVD